MCGRFTFTRSASDLASHFELAGWGAEGADSADGARVPEQTPRYNIAPTQPITTVRAGSRGRLAVSQRWGLIPRWAKDPSIASRMINARSETAAEKPAFRDALRERRCLVPADGFFEWSGRRDRRVPHWIRLGDGEIFAIAGLWERWRSPANEWVETCTLLTTEANATIEPLHDRMPVILSPVDYDRWLDPAIEDPCDLLPLLVPCAADLLVAKAVGSRVNDVRNDDPACVEPAPASEIEASQIELW